MGNLGTHSTRSRLLGGALCSSFTQGAPGSSLEDSDVFDVYDAPPDLEGTLVLQAPECPCHRFSIRPDHGA